MRVYLVTLEVGATAKRLAEACRNYANGWPFKCTVGQHFGCPFRAKKECRNVSEVDWETVTKAVTVDGIREKIDEN